MARGELMVLSCVVLVEFLWRAEVCLATATVGRVKEDAQRNREDQGER